MRWLFTVFVVLSSIAAGSVKAQTLDCQSAFTNMEQAICSDRQLSDLFSQMQQKSEVLVARRLLSEEARTDMRDDLARSCSASDHLEKCLLIGMSGAVTMLSDQLAGAAGAEVQSRPLSDAAVSLQKLSQDLSEAQTHFDKTEEPQQLVTTLLAMLDHYEDQTTESVTVKYEMRAVRAKLVSGCSDLRVRSRWNRALQSYGRACPLNLAQLFE